MAQFAGKDAWLLVDGFDLLTGKIKTLREKVLNPVEDSTGLGDEWEETSPTGSRKSELSQEGALFDDATDATHDALSASVPSSASATARVVCCGFAGQTVGKEFIGFEGVFTPEYEHVGVIRGLQKVNTRYEIDGAREPGVILQVLEAETIDWDTEAASVDNGASSSNGGSGYIEVKEFSGWDDLTARILHSSDDITFAELLSFTLITARTAERVTVSGTVNRYLAMDGVYSGAGPGTSTIFAGFSRS